MEFTAGQIWTFIIAVFGLALTVINLFDKVVMMRKKANEPMEQLEERVRTLEVKADEYERNFRHGSEDFKEIRDSLETLQNCLSIIVDFEVSFCDRMEYKEGSSEIMEARKRLRELSAKQ